MRLADEAHAVIARRGFQVRTAASDLRARQAGLEALGVPRSTTASARSANSIPGDVMWSTCWPEAAPLMIAGAGARCQVRCRCRLQVSGAGSMRLAPMAVPQVGAAHVVPSPHELGCCSPGLYIHHMPAAPLLHPYCSWAQPLCVCKFTPTLFHWTPMMKDQRCYLATTAAQHTWHLGSLAALSCPASPSLISASLDVTSSAICTSTEARGVCPECTVLLQAEPVARHTCVRARR